MKFRNVGRRLSEIRRYMALGRSPRDWAALSVLGIARGHPFSSSDIFSSVGRRFFPELVVRPTRLGGLRLALDPSDVTHLVIFDEVVRDNNYDLSLVPFEPDQIFDCGGHIGMFSVLASARFPKTPVTIFEPNPRNLARIRRQVELNHLNVEVMAAAVSVNEGTATFEDRVSFSGQLVDDAEPSIGGGSGRYSVRTIDFSTILKNRRPERLLLKLDIEGEETKVIPQLFDAMPAISVVFFETHQSEPGWESAAKQFSDHGFTVTRRRSMENCVDGFALRR
jgi:FkbM family methyltransferase